MHTVSIKTIIIITLFASGYMFFIIRKTARGQLDLYDLVMLSAVAIIPSSFAIFPQFANFLAVITGVLFPFVVLFGTLLAILFVFIHRLTVKIHILESDNRLFLQELSLLKQTVEYADNKKDRAPQTGPPIVEYVDNKKSKVTQTGPAIVEYVDNKKNRAP